MEAWVKLNFRDGVLLESLHQGRKDVLKIVCYLDFVKVQRQKGHAFYSQLWETSLTKCFSFSLSFGWELKELLQNFGRTVHKNKDTIFCMNWISWALLLNRWCENELWLRKPDSESSSQCLVLYRHLDTTKILKKPWYLLERCWISAAILDSFWSSGFAQWNQSEGRLGSNRGCLNKCKVSLKSCRRAGQGTLKNVEHSFQYI